MLSTTYIGATIMAKEVQKQNNPVAKFANMFNKCAKMKDKKREAKCGKAKHKNNKRSEEVFLTFNFM